MEKLLVVLLLASAVAAMNYRKRRDLNYQQTFSHFDQDGDSTVTTHELFDVLGKKGFTMSELKNAIKQVDQNGNGVIDLISEFKNIADNNEHIIKQLRFRRDLNYQKTFSHFDQDGDSTVTTHELFDVLGKKGFTISELMNAIKQVDQNENGVIDLISEFKNIADNNEHIIKQLRFRRDLNYQKTFSHFDQDGDSTVTTHELFDVLGKKGFTMSELKNAIKQVDQNGNGVIDLISEFKNIADNNQGIVKGLGL